jgi:lipid II:glycine glycyltransferase (peptidoglycan interpeptide bridge formation enzyme)
VRRGTDRAALDAFYRLHTATRRRQGVPVQPRSFIRRLEGLFAQGLGHVALAEHDGAVAAAAVFVGFGRTLTYKYGASDAAHLAVRPNNAIFAETIRWASDEGYAELDFGRTDLDNPGLATFKRNWGAEEREVAYVRLPPRGDEPDEEPGAARRLASAVIKRSPPFVGRAVGAALYRHFG